jgi:hypothetical protein
MPALLVDRDRRGRKACVRKGPHRNGDVLFVTFFDVENRRAAFGAESERECSAFVSHPNELRAVALEAHGLAREACLRAKDAAGSALASVAMADGGTDRLSEDLRPELTRNCKMQAELSFKDSYGVSCGA